MELRITAKDEMFEEVNEISFLISVYKNPQLFWGAQDIPEAERLAEIARLEDLFEQLMH